jgi:SAM-dependent methyltransferase
MKTYDLLDLTDPMSPGMAQAVLGNHALWLPSFAVKVPWQFGARLCKRTRPGEATYPLDSIVDEVCILRALAEQGMAPPIGDIVYFRNVVSTFPGAHWIDPCGAYGYQMTSAQSLPPGRFPIDAMRKLPIEASEAAWSDILVKGRDNVVNGYLIDVRRSGQDMFRWTGPRFVLPDAREPADELRARIHRECQFPPGERAEAYQDFWLRGTMERGQRRVVERAEAMGFCPQPGESVLDIGCQSGGFLQYAWHATGGRGRYVGVDIDAGYVDCARALARSYGQNICFRRMDVEAERDAFLLWVRACFPNGVDHLLLMSMEKWINIFPLIDAVGARASYIETNAVKSEGNLKHWEHVKPRGGSHVGFSRDRNLRALYRINRQG